MILPMINFCIFEDDYYPQLFPLTDVSPIYDCLLGQSTLFEKFESQFSHGNITLHCRDYLKPSLKKTYKDYSINAINTGAPCLFFNGRTVLTPYITSQLNAIDKANNTLITYKNTLVAAYLKGSPLNTFATLLSSPLNNKEAIKQLRSECVSIECEQADIITAPWDIIKLNKEHIESDFIQSNQPGIIKGAINPFTVIYNENNVFINKQTTIEDFVVINAENGPVYIDDNVHIQAHTRIEGPTYIGSHSTILGGKIKASSIGHHCKVSGEVSNCIFQPYSNKAHDGFFGDSYVGKWANIGAGTTTSNLKTNYSPISVSIKNKKVPTKEQFLGTIIGDYVKTAIGTLLNCGTIIQSGSTLINHDQKHQEYPLFSWGTPTTTHDIDKFIETTKKMMKRRNCTLNESDIELFHFLYSAQQEK